MKRFKKLVVFDVDKTLIKKDSLIITAIYNRSLFFILFKLIFLIPFYILWICKILSTNKFKEKFIETFEICEKINKIDKNNNWLENILKKEIRKEALERIKMHKKNGDFIVLCTASPRMIIEPLADFLNVKLICTEMVYSTNKWIPKIKGKNCNGNEKLKRLKDNININKFNLLEVYGDSRGDKEILQAADIPHFKSFNDNPKKYPYFSIVSLLPFLGLFFLIYSLFGEWVLGPKEIFLIKENFSQIFFGLFLITFGYLIRYLRWRYIISYSGLDIPIIKDFLIWMGSFTFTATPGKTGESIRSYILKDKFNIKYEESLFAMIYERLNDFLAVILICSFNINFLKKLDFQFFYFFKICFLIFSAIIIFFYLFRRLTFLKRISNTLRIRYSNIFYSFDNLIINLKTSPLISFKVILISTFLGTFSWILEGISFFLILKSFNTEINFSESAFIHLSSGLIGAISLLPGGIGSAELSSISLLTLLGVSFSTASSATLIIRLMTLWYATFSGLLCLIILQSSNFKKI